MKTNELQVLKKIKNICTETDELKDGFTEIQARNCDNALSRILKIIDDLLENNK